MAEKAEGTGACPPPRFGAQKWTSAFKPNDLG